MLLTKEIIPSNTYKVRSNQGRIKRKFDPEYLQKIADTSNQMLAAGLKIPAPFDHHKDARPRTEQQEKEWIALNESKSSFENAGYWQHFWVAPNSKGVPSLYGKLDAVGDISDSKSPAFKVKNSNQEVSVSIADNFEDGLERTWTDGLLHVAVVHHAVVPGQEPFMEGVTVVNMSMVEESEPGSGSESVVEELKVALRKLNVNLTGSTNAASFLKDLLIAVNQIPDKGHEGIEPVPIYMSIGDTDMAMSKEQAESIVATKAVNPATKQPFTMEDLGFKPAPAKESLELQASLAEKDKTISGLMQLTAALKNKFINDAKQVMQQRISALVNAKVIPKEYADAHLVPNVEFQMSILDGQIQPHPLEITLSALETAIPQKKSEGSFPKDGVVQHFELPDAELSDDAMDAALKAMEADGLL
jgi:hypothetical protein